MAQRLSDYFVLEAGEYLDQLDALLAASGAPDAERIFRLARGIRGSAQMAEAGRVAEVAAQLESAARGLAEGRMTWSDELHASALRTVDDLRVLVRGARQWGSAEEARAQAALARWSSAQPTAAPDAPAAAQEGARLFPFVHMELIGVRGELDRALLDMETAPGHAEPLHAVLRRTRAVRGIQGYAVLGPTLRMMATLDEAVRGVIAAAPAVGAAQMALLAAARALLSECIDALASGAAPSESAPAWTEFQQLATGAAAGRGAEEPDVVSIATLFYDDAGPHILDSPIAAERCTPAEMEADVVPIESLLLRGDAAARAALALRAQVDARLAEIADRGGVAEALGASIDEVFALIQLALEPAPAD